MIAGESGVTVEVWWAHLDQARADFAADLDAVERARWTAYHREQDKARFLLGVSMIRRILAARTSLPPATIWLDRTCPDCGKPHGKVRADGVELSVTHSGDLVGVALSNKPVGLDVEKIDPRLDVDGIARIAFTPDEARQLDGYAGIDKARAFTALWTRKEAVLKVTGEGLTGDLRAAAPPGLHVEDLDVGPDHRAALAVDSADPPAVRVLMFGSTPLR